MSTINLTPSAMAEVYKNEGKQHYIEKDYTRAIASYSEGIQVECDDEELNAKLYSNRAVAHYRLGKRWLML